MKKIYKTELAVAFVLAIFLIAGYQYFLYQENISKSKTTQIPEITDAKTGKAISQEEIAKIEAQQKIEKRTFSLSGSVVSKNQNGIIIKREGGQNVSVKLFSGGTVVTMKNNDEHAIKIADIQIGEMASVVFPDGVTESEMTGNTDLFVRRISIYSPATDE
jgi:hypothetical protein